MERSNEVECTRRPALLWLEAYFQITMLPASQMCDFSFSYAFSKAAILSSAGGRVKPDKPCSDAELIEEWRKEESQ